jgi:hypothetical protein
LHGKVCRIGKKLGIWACQWAMMVPKRAKNIDIKRGENVFLRGHTLRTVAAGTYKTLDSFLPCYIVSCLVRKQSLFPTRRTSRLHSMYMAPVCTSLLWLIKLTSGIILLQFTESLVRNFRRSFAVLEQMFNTVTKKVYPR